MPAEGKDVQYRGVASLLTHQFESLTVGIAERKCFIHFTEKRKEVN
jgi:hypothetical protein